MKTCPVSGWGGVKAQELPQPIGTAVSSPDASTTVLIWLILGLKQVTYVLCGKRAETDGYCCVKAWGRNPRTVFYTDPM